MSACLDRRCRRSGCGNFRRVKRLLSGRDRFFALDGAIFPRAGVVPVRRSGRGRGSRQIRLNRPLAARIRFGGILALSSKRGFGSGRGLGGLRFVSGCRLSLNLRLGGSDGFGSSRGLDRTLRCGRSLGLGGAVVAPATGGPSSSALGKSNRHTLSEEELNVFLKGIVWTD